jgi:hypothetical protein
VGAAGTAGSAGAAGNGWATVELPLCMTAPVAGGMIG